MRKAKIEHFYVVTLEIPIFDQIMNVNAIVTCSFTAGHLLSFSVDSIHLGFGGWHRIESTSLTYQ